MKFPFVSRKKYERVLKDYMTLRLTAAAIDTGVYDAIYHYPEGKERNFTGDAKKVYDGQFLLVTTALRQAGAKDDFVLRAPKETNNAV